LGPRLAGLRFLYNILTQTDLVFGIKHLIFALLARYIIMSKEVLEISVLVDEKFDVKFDLAEGFLGFLFRIFGK